jgi:Cys-tRNA(Pro) deacylase
MDGHPADTHPNIARVLLAAEGAGLAITVQRFPEGTRTAVDAARAVGCAVSQIVKSLVFMADDRAVVALVAGDDRLDLAKLAVATGTQQVRRADGDEARSATGYAIGGVPPLGYAGPVPVFMDTRLLAHDQVWAAAGLPDAVFSVQPSALAAAAGAQFVDLAEDR